MKLIEAEKFPSLDEISQENASSYLSSELPLVWIAAKLKGDDEKSDNKESIVNTMKPLTKAYKGKLLFVLLNVDVFGGQATSMGITKFPGVMVQNADKKYLYPGQLNDTQALSQFFEEFFQEKVVAFRKTQDPPQQHEDEAFVLVGSTFEDHVGTDKQDAFVDFYADWCPPCQRMAPTYKELAKTFKGINGLMIAKINADKNDTFQKVESYPTILFFKKGSKTGIKYEGDRSLNSFIEFVKLNATVDCSSVK